MNTSTKTHVKGRKGRALTEAEFNQIKVLSTAGFSNVQISTIVNRSQQVVGGSRKYESLQAYREAMRAYTEALTKRKQANQEVGKLVTEVAEEKAKSAEVSTSSEPSVPIESSTAERALLRIADAMERLVEAWERTPENETKSRRFF